MNPDDEVIDAEIVEDTALQPVEAAPVAISGAHALQAIRESIVALDDQRAELARQGDVANLAYGAADLAAVAADLKVVERQARMDIATVLDSEWLAAGKMKLRDDGTPTRLPDVEVPGLGKVKVSGGRERVDWESERLLRRLIAQALVTEDGELVEFETPNDAIDAMFDALSPCLPLTGSLQWRVGSEDKATSTFTGLRGQGIDPDEWCDIKISDRVATVPRRPEGSAT